MVVEAIPTAALAFCNVEPAVLTTFKIPPYERYDAALNQ